MTGIADTGFLVAFANRKDRYHSWAAEVASRVDRALLTCEAVLAETAFHLENASLVMAMVQEGLVEPQFALRDHLARLAELRNVTRIASRIWPISASSGSAK
jgi:predicted nucleic acid-binding protein